MIGRAIRGGLAAGALVLGTPAIGQAATVQVVGGSEAVRYVAASGERNDLTFTAIEDSWPSAFLVTDPSAVVATGPGCLPIDAHNAVCISRSGAMYHLVARLGDGDDVLHPAGFNLVDADGGPGDDRLMGGTWDDRLDGGGGRDELHGGPGDDTLLDGDRDGTGPTPDSDILDGGDGGDWVSYQQRTEPVAVDLSARTPAGERGEGDVLTGIESIRGGRGDDRLTGDDGPNAFAGGGGENRMTGRGGNDVFIAPSRGRDDCGSGTDEVRGVTRRSRLTVDCETVFRGEGGFHVSANPRPTAGGMTFSLWCGDDGDDWIVCSGTVTITSAARTLARGVLRAGVRQRTVRLTLTPAGRALLARRSVQATVELHGTGLPDLAWSIALPRRP